MIQDQLRDFILYNGADKMVGRIESFTPPTLEVMKEDMRFAGMDTSMPVDMGMVALEATWITSGIDKGMYGAFGLMNGLRTSVIVRAALVDPVTGIAKPVQHKLVGNITKLEPAAYQVGQKAGITVSMSLVFYEVMHSGLPITTIDVINGIRIINGVDQLAQLRAYTGR